MVYYDFDVFVAEADIYLKENDLVQAGEKLYGALNYCMKSFLLKRCKISMRTHAAKEKLIFDLIDVINLDDYKFLSWFFSKIET